MIMIFLLNTTSSWAKIEPIPKEVPFTPKSDGYFLERDDFQQVLLDKKLKMACDLEKKELQKNLSECSEEAASFSEKYIWAMAGFILGGYLAFQVK